LKLPKLRGILKRNRRSWLPFDAKGDDRVSPFEKLSLVIAILKILHDFFTE